MIHALRRQVIASIRQSALQSFFVFITLMGAAVAVTMAIALWQRSSAAWEHEFAQSNAPQVVLYGMTADIDSSPLKTLLGVSAVSSPVPMLNTYTLSNDSSSIAIAGLGPDPGALEKPKITQGRWLTSSDTHSIVIDAGYARANHFSVGDTIEIAGGAGSERFTIVGLSVTLWRSPYPEADSPMMYVLPESVARLLVTDSARSIIMMRVTDPGSARTLASSATAALPAGSICCVSTWLDVRDDINDITSINLGLLGVLAVLALLAAGFVIASTIAGRVTERERSIGLLKAIGETPEMITVSVILEQLLLALPAGLIGFLVGIWGSRVFLLRGADPYGASPAVRGYLGWLPLFLLAYLGVVILFALLPAWRGSRREMTQTLRPAQHPIATAPSWSGRISARLRLPLPVRLGLKDLSTHPVRELLTACSIALIVSTLVIAVSAERTLAGYRNGAIWAANPPELRVDTGSEQPETTARIIAATAGIATSYNERVIRATINGSDTTHPLRAVSGDIASLGLRIVEGRMFTAPGEMIAGQGLLDATGLRIGDSLTITVAGQPLTLHLVGRYVEFEGRGDWGMLDRATFDGALPDLAPTSWYLQLVQGTDLAGARAEIVTKSNGRLFVTEIKPDASRRDVFEIRLTIYSAAAILALIGAIHIVTTSFLDLRERTRELGILQALGLTPREIAIGAIARVVALALLGVGLGSALGWFGGSRVYDHYAVSDGLGRGLAEHLTWMHFAVLIPAIVLFALLSAAAPIAHALRPTPAEALRYE